MTITGIYYLTRLLVTLVAIPIHEMGHALASWLLGDPTARAQGRLSLNPLRHFDLLGTLCMVVAGGRLGEACLHRPAPLQKSEAGDGGDRPGRPGGQPGAGLPVHGRVEGGLLLGPRPMPSASMRSIFCST